MTRERKRKDSTPEPMTSLDHLVLDLGAEEIMIRSHGNTKKIAGDEALLRKAFETALKGSPHAQRQMLERLHLAEAKQQALREKDMAYWCDYRDRGWRAISAAKQRGDAEPRMLPHPDDIHIDPGAGVRIDGPMNEAEMKVCEVTRRTVLAWLYQDALERRLDGRSPCEGFEVGDAYSTALLVNEGLPKRLKLSSDDIINLRMRLAHLPKRTLLKDTKTAWKSAGQTFARGARVLPADRARLFEGLAFMARQIDNCDDDPNASRFMLLDGNLRVLALKELGHDTAPCLIARDFETYTYNHRINRLSTVQEHYMLRRAIDKGVSKERLARAFNVNLSTINSRVNLLHGICPKAVELLQDHQFTPDVTRHLRKMKPARQIEAVELMIAAGTITGPHADALLRATPPEQRTDHTPPKPEEPKGDPLEQIVKLEREMNQVQEQYKRTEETYGSDLLNLVVAKGYLKKLMENPSVHAFVGRTAPEILEQFELVLSTVSMEEAVEQADRDRPEDV